MTTLVDGTGGGSRINIDQNNRMHVHAIDTPEAWRANEQGDAYNINTGVITLTDSVDTPVLYLKNNETRDLRIAAIAVGLGPSTDGSGGIPKITVVRNPTVGTIITSTPTDVDVNSNRNYGSAKTLSVDAYKGATGDTMTNGEDHILFFQGAGGRLFATIDELLPKGASIGIKIDPQPSNSSMDVYCALICHLVDEADKDKN